MLYQRQPILRENLQILLENLYMALAVYTQ